MTINRKIIFLAGLIFWFSFVFPVHADRFYEWFHYDDDAALNTVWDKNGDSSDFVMGYKGPSYHYSYSTLTNLLPGFALREVNLFRTAGFPVAGATLQAVVQTLLNPVAGAIAKFIAIKDPYGVPSYYESVTSWSINDAAQTKMSLIDIAATDFVHMVDGVTNPDLNQITHVGIQFSVFNPQPGQGFNTWSYSLTPEPETYLMAGSALVMLLFLGF